MASAQVTIKVSVAELRMLIGCVDDSIDTLQDLIDDPVVKEDDKHNAMGEQVQLKHLLRQISS